MPAKRPSRSTSKPVAAKAARVLRDPTSTPEERSVAASALAQVEATNAALAEAISSSDNPFNPDDIGAGLGGPLAGKSPFAEAAFDPDDFRATVLEQCVRGAGAVGFNLASVDDVLTAMRVVGELGRDYNITAFGKRVEVTRL